MATKTIMPTTPKTDHQATIAKAVEALNKASAAAAADGLEVEIRHEEPYDAKTPKLSALVGVRSP